MVLYNKTVSKLTEVPKFRDADWLIKIYIDNYDYFRKKKLFIFGTACGISGLIASASSYARTSLRIRAISPEPSLHAYTQYACI